MLWNAIGFPKLRIPDIYCCELVVSWRDEGSKGFLFCFTEKIFCDVLFPVEDRIAISCPILQCRPDRIREESRGPTHFKAR